MGKHTHARTHAHISEGFHTRKRSLCERELTCPHVLDVRKAIKPLQADFKGKHISVH